MEKYNKTVFYIIIALLIVGVLVSFQYNAVEAQPARSNLYWGSTGSDVVLVQRRLSQWDYYQGPIDGVFGAQTWSAVRLFQRRNGLTVDGIVGPKTYGALGIPVQAAGPGVATSPGPVSAGDDIDLLARVIQAEAGGEPYTGQVAVGAVILNRIQNASFPNSLVGVVYQPLAFESVAIGTIYSPADADALRAARQALNGWDPTYGALYFWNPAKPVSPWIWTRQIVTRIGQHVFGI